MKTLVIQCPHCSHYHMAGVENLRAVLDDALNARSNPDYFIPLIELDKADKSPNTAEPRTVAFLVALRAEPALEVFQGKVHTIGGRPHTTDHKNLAHWLIWRASETTTEQALADLTTYLSAKEVECVHTLPFRGLTPEDACEFDPSITLLPWGSFFDSAEKHRIEEELARQPPYGTLIPAEYSKPTGALIHRSQARIAILDEADVDWRLSEMPSQVSDLHDALMCIGLTVPPAPPALGCWTKDEVPEVGTDTRTMGGI
jgi:hypothetical protein